MSYDTAASANFREQCCVGVIDEFNIWKDPKNEHQVSLSIPPLDGHLV